MAAEAEPNWSHVLSMVPLCLTIIFRCALDSRFYKSKKWCAWGGQATHNSFHIDPLFSWLFDDMSRGLADGQTG